MRPTDEWTWREIWRLLHDAWGKAKNAPEYDKRVWIDLQARLEEAQERMP